MFLVDVKRPCKGFDEEEDTHFLRQLDSWVVTPLSDSRMVRGGVREHVLTQTVYLWDPTEYWGIVTTSHFPRNGRDRKGFCVSPLVSRGHLLSGPCKEEDGRHQSKTVNYGMSHTSTISELSTKSWDRRVILENLSKTFMRHRSGSRTIRLKSLNLSHNREPRNISRGPNS